MKGISRVVFAVFAACALSGALAAAAPAQPKAVAEPRADVILGGKLLWIFRAGAGGLSPMQRADACVRRSVEILSDPAASEKEIKIVVPKRGDEPQIWVRKHLFVTVTVADAKINGIDPMGLAKIWAKKLYEGLSIARVHRPEEKF